MTLNWMNIMQIGNAAVNDETDQKGMYDFLGNHAIQSEATTSTIDKFCDFSPNVQTQAKNCDEALQDSDRDSYYIDIYNIYAPLCDNSNLTATPNPVSVRFTYLYSHALFMHIHSYNSPSSGEYLIMESH